MSMLKNFHDIVDSLEDTNTLHIIDKLIEEVSREAKKDIEFLQLLKSALQK